MKGTRRRLWRVHLTEDMVAKLEAAFSTVPVGKTTVVAYLMSATGATRSNVHGWLLKDRQMPWLSLVVVQEPSRKRVRPSCGERSALAETVYTETNAQDATGWRSAYPSWPFVSAAHRDIAGFFPRVI